MEINMAFLCINPKVAMIRLRAGEGLEELTGEFYLNLDKVIEIRMKPVRAEHDGDFCADVLIILQDKTHEFVFRNSPAGNKAKQTLAGYLAEQSINC
ncbi:MAG: hypothetical protein ACJAW8_002181 [Oleispira sp.]|jgi:hypothetical protein|tara:strand:+ start:5993 stop:6283 length:291 start_codon:yes stop_codon:yes gene_type:complete